MDYIVFDKVYYPVRELWINGYKKIVKISSEELNDVLLDSAGNYKSKILGRASFARLFYVFRKLFGNKAVKTRAESAASFCKHFLQFFRGLFREEVQAESVYRARVQPKISAQIHYADTGDAVSGKLHLTLFADR